MNRRRFLALFGLGALGGATTTGLVHPKLRGASTAPLLDEELEALTSGLHRIIWSVDTHEPMAALTFDDGPDPDFTPRILEILDRHGVKATFFAMGYNAMQHPGLLRDVVAAGHEVGSHGWSHLNLAETTPARTKDEIEFGTRMVEEQAGVPIRLFRPPYGRFGEAAVRVLAGREHDMVVWSVTRGDLSWQDPGRIASHIVQSVSPGGIIDLHDGIGRGTFNRGSEIADRLRRRREVEVEALPQILKGARSRNLRLGTVSDLMEMRREVGEGS